MGDTGMGRAIVELLLAAFIWLVGIVVVFMAFDSTQPERSAKSGDGHAQAQREATVEKSPHGQGPTKEMDTRLKEQKEKSAVSGDYEHFLAHDGRERRYLVHVPKNAPSTVKLPVVLAFHGGMGRAEGFQVASQLNQASDRFGFLAVYPDGTGLTRMLTFNAGNCCGYASRERVDDVGFVKELLRKLPEQYAVDPQRFYATGFSNGAMLCYRLACELSDQIVAIAPVSGDMGVDGPEPKRFVPVLHFHGMQDQNCLFQGGKGKNQFQPVPHRSVAETLAFWIKWNNCQPTPTEVKERDFIRKEYHPAPGQKGAPVILYALPEGGHTWPGGVDTTAHLNTGKLIKTVDANTIMWNFFKQFRMDSPEKANREAKHS
jgi:polyhydroxybutyrate depolymerase